METTANTSARSTEMTKNGELSVEGKVSKKALITFLCGATIVFSGAIYYCFTTNHTPVGGALIGAYVLICIFAATIAKSFK